MASQEDVMRLVAEVVDKSSPQLKKIQQALRNMGSDANKSHTEAAKAAREHSKHIKELHERIEKLTDIGLEGLTPALAEMGIAGISAGAVFGALAEKIKAAGEDFEKFQSTIARSGMGAK